MSATCFRSAKLLKFRPKPLARWQHSSGVSKQFTVTVTQDGDTVYIPQSFAEALGWTKDAPIEGVSLRLSGWEPHYFAITQKGTDADRLAHATIESSRNPAVQATLEYMKKNDSQ